MTPIEAAAIFVGTFIASVALGAFARSVHVAYEAYALAHYPDDIEGGEHP